MDGYGVYFWQDGRRYEGSYLKDKKDGFGTYTWADGRQYVGMWKNGKQHGEGKYTVSPPGTTRNGIWEEGKRKRWI
jgi:hypothetical protein